jgi:hypothetical protein
LQDEFGNDVNILEDGSAKFKNITTDTVATTSVTASTITTNALNVGLINIASKIISNPSTGSVI